MMNNDKNKTILYVVIIAFFLYLIGSATAMFNQNKQLDDFLTKEKELYHKVDSIEYVNDSISMVNIELKEKTDILIKSIDKNIDSLKIIAEELKKPISYDSTEFNNKMKELYEKYH